MSLVNIEPKSVFKYFEEISNIPRGSKNEKNISDYLVSFAKKHSLEVYQDKKLNVIIRKSASKGYENSKGVILQGHMDMVCEKNSNTIHDFSKDPIKLKVVDNMLYADNTTLGADNGVAIAYALAILESNTIEHPPLEVVITTEEEIGMGGAMALNPSLIKGKYLINIDSEEEGSLLVSCCGGAKTILTLPVKYEKVNSEYSNYSIIISGLNGGHSGMDIIKQRANANKIIGRILSILSNENIDFYISDINGGSKVNAIPRECKCSISFKSSEYKVVSSIINDILQNLKKEYESVDDNMCITIEENNFVENVFSKESTKNIISIISFIPNGIDTMSQVIENLPQSSNNLGVISTLNNTVVFENALRSNISSLKQDILNRHKLIADTFNCDFIVNGDYPEWEYINESHLRNVFVESYKEMFNKEPIITAIHAGLECGILKEKMPHLDIISFGPDHFDVHSPNEHLSIPSTERMWNYLLDVLKRLK